MSAFVSKKYSYRKGTVSHGVPAQTVGRVLESIEQKGIEVTAESFLDASRPEDSPTHKIFTWNDGIAAEKWRLHESKTILNHLEVEITYVKDSPSQVVVAEVDEKTETKIKSRSAYVNVNPKKFGQRATFVPVEVAMSNEEMRLQVLKNVLSDLLSYQKRYEDFEELREVFEAIDSVAQKIGMMVNADD